MEVTTDWWSAANFPRSWENLGTLGCYVTGNRWTSFYEGVHEEHEQEDGLVELNFAQLHLGAQVLDVSQLLALRGGDHVLHLGTQMPKVKAT